MRRINYRSISKTIFIVTISLFAQACAFGTRHALLQYPPPDSQVEASRDGLLEKSALANNYNVVVNQFSDKRTEPLVGHVRNGWGIKTADVVGVGDVPSWIKGAIEHELKNSGVRIANTNQAEIQSDTLVVNGQVIKAYCSMYATYEAEVLINVTIKDFNGREILSRTYQGAGSAGMVWSASAESFSLSLSLALQQVAKAFAVDFVKLK